MNSSKKTILYVVSILASSILIAILLKATEPKAKNTTVAPAPPLIDVITVTEKNLTPTVILTGRLHPAHKAQLKFEIRGKIAERMVEPGQKVNYGQNLLKLESGEYVDILAESTAKLVLEKHSIERDKRLLKLAMHNSALQAREVSRLSKLGRGALVSKSLLGQARQKLYQLQSEEARLKFSVDSAEARVKLPQVAVSRAKRNLDRTILKAPFSGSVNGVFVDKGDSVVTSKIVLELISTRQLELRLNIRNEVASALDLGIGITVTYDGNTYIGKIVGLQSDPDSTTFTHLLRIRLPENIGMPGRIATSKLMLGKLDKVLAIPASAVIREENNAYVMVVDNDTVQQRQVTLGPRVRDLHIVNSGLKKGEIIVIRDIASFKDGQKIRVRD